MQWCHGTIFQGAYQTYKESNEKGRHGIRKINEAILPEKGTEYVKSVHV